jgi:hypothetical protein
MDWERRGPLLLAIGTLALGLAIGFFVGKMFAPTYIQIPSILAKTINFEEVSKCKGLAGDALDTCIFYEAMDKRNLQYCVWVTNAEFRNLCMAAITHEPKFCYRIFSDYYKRQCTDVVEGRIRPEYIALIKVAEKPKVPEKCKQIAGPQFDLCIIDEAANSGNYYLCNLIKDSDTAHYCMAMAAKSEKFCELIKGSQLNTRCRNYFVNSS